MMPNRVEIDTFCDMFCVKIRQLTDMIVNKENSAMGLFLHSISSFFFKRGGIGVFRAMGFLFIFFGIYIFLYIYL